MQKHIYVVTTKYGKELRAELELGDAVFPYDNNVEIVHTKFKGVLILKTKLSFKELIKILLVFPPSCVERIVPVGTCCRLNNLLECIDTYIRSCGVSYGNYRFGRKGSLSKELITKIREVADKYIKKGDNRVLHIEPINDEVCLGITELDEDKFHKLREARLSNILRYIKGSKSII